MKKIFSLFLTFVFVAGMCVLIPTNVNAASVSDIEFELNSERTAYQVKTGNPDISGELVIPESYNGFPVISIADSAFCDCIALTDVVIPDSVISIGERAFYGCPLLKSVAISRNVKYIGDEAFGYQYNEKTYESDKIEGFTIYGMKGTAAELYAKGWEVDFVVNGISLKAPKVIAGQADEGIKLFWNPVEDAEYYIISKSKYNFETDELEKVVTLSENHKKTVYIDSTVKLGEKYSYTVVAVNGDTVSEAGNTESFKYNVTPVVKISNASSGVKVSWTTAPNVTGYTVYTATYNAKTKTWSGWKNRGTTKATTKAWTDKKVKSGVKYKYMVKARNGSFKSFCNPTSSIRYLARPTVAVKVLSNGIKIGWTQSVGATEYKVYRSQYNETSEKWGSWKVINTSKSSAKSYVDKTAKKGVKYKYTVKAVNGKFASSFKSSSSIKR